MGAFALTTDAAVLETPAETPAEIPSQDTDNLSTAGTPASTDAPPAAEAGRSEGQEAPGTESAPEPEILSLAELDAKAKREGLTPAEYQRQQQLQREQDDRRANEQRWLATEQQREADRRQRLAASLQTRNQNVVAAVEQELEQAAEEMRKPSMQLIRSLVNGHLEAHDREAAAVYQAPIAQSIYDIGVQLMGDSYQTRQQLAHWTPQEAVIELVQRAFASGQLTGPGNDHVVLAKKDYEKALADARKAGGDAIKAQHGLGAASATSSTNGGVSTKLYSQMSTEERQAMSPAERDAAVAYEAQQRSRG